jgi:D-glycero-alpha-D-manno-heptose 1-phosphate guanylyltransferase
MMINQIYQCNVPCVILAGGIGTRLAAELSGVPKCMAPVGKRTFLDLQIEYLLGQGMTNIIISLGYLGDVVVQHLQKCAYNDSVRFVVEPTALGTGGAISHVMNYFDINEVVVVNGDTYLDGSITEFCSNLRINELEYVRMGVAEVQDRSRFGGVILNNESIVTGFYEKGQLGSGLINAGVYRVNKYAFSGNSNIVFSFEEECLPKLVSNHNVKAQFISGRFVDIGIPSAYQEFCRGHIEN